MSWIADAHADWHVAHGWNSGCPLDCAAADVAGWEEYDPAPLDSAPAEEWEAYAQALFDSAEYVSRQQEQDAREPDPWDLVPF